jgi:hypothetical protein
MTGPIPYEKFCLKKQKNLQQNKEIFVLQEFNRTRRNRTSRRRRDE